MTHFAVILLNRAVDSADLAIFPCVYKKLEEQFQVGPSTLGSIFLAQAVARSLSCPLWGFVADRWSKRKLIAFGCLLWGLATILTATSQHPLELYLWRILCGLGLGCVTPILQTLVADHSQTAQLGHSFGLLSISGMLGGLVGNILATNLDDWRRCFWIVGCISLLLAVSDWFLITDRHKLGVAQFTLAQVKKEILTIFSSQSLLIIMLQGVIGTVPWVSMSYLTIFMQSSGFTNGQVTFINTAFMICCGFGGYLGGLIGDRLHKLVPYDGRVYCAQASVLAGIPMVIVLFAVLSPTPDNFYSFLLSFSILGLVCSWCSTGCNRPLMLDIVSPELRASAISWVVAVDDSLSGVAAPIVGQLAESYGYKVAGQKATPEILSQNASALRSSLYHAMLWPWVFCLLSYSLLYWTYKDEVKKIKSYRHLL
ncbi:hypothetical protein HDU91_000382 [Kappamyces sp. JEL0680]|nr:hypothetical protein HDU91_000382 [Kappamyces sp. JEL0680]